VSMTSPLKASKLLIAGILALMLAACQTLPPRAPVSERTPPRDQPVAKPTAPAPDASSDLYAVKRGDTLYSIALEHRVDHRELAAMNNLTPTATLRVGQQLRIKKAAVIAEAANPENGATTSGLGASPPVVGAAIPEAAEPPSVTPAAAPATTLKSQPKAVRMPYSDQVLAELKAAEPPRPQPEALPPMVVKIDPKPEAAPPPEGPDAVDWGWPAQGKLITSFSETAKGVDISGKAGQPVFATAAGKVVYSGTGLRGYGKLIIIKHNKTYLSAYAHNREILVKEGETVVKGQRIAEMGNSDADQVKLHFEIRKQGKPVDPMRYLPPEKAS